MIVIEEKDREDLKYIIETLSQITNELDYYNDNIVTIDLCNQSYIYPWIYSVITNWYSLQKDNGFKVRFEIINASTQTLNYASRIEFFNKIDYTYEENFVRHSEKGRFVPIESFHEYDANLPSKITEVFINKKGLDTRKSKDNNIAYMLEFCLSEILENIDRHADSHSGGYVIVQPRKLWDKTNNIIGANLIDICISDSGIGIPQSLRKTEEYSHWENTLCLLKSTQKNVTTKAAINPGMGNGLYILKKLIREAHGVLEIASDNAYYIYDSLGNEIREESFEINGYWQGTIVRFRYIYDTDIDIQDIMDDQYYDPFSQYLEIRNEILDTLESKINTYKIRNDDFIIKLSNYGSSLSERKVASNINDSINYNYQNNVVFDFEGVELVTSSFTDELFGKKSINIGFETYMNKIEIVNSNPNITILIKKSFLDRSLESV